MQHAGLQYGQGAANSHQSPPFAHADISQTNGGNTTSSLRQFRKKDGPDKNSTTDLSSSVENSHIARVPPHNHYPARPSNEYYRYPQQYPDYNSPYKETPAQVKYSEIAETPHQPIQHVDHMPAALQKHKEVHKDFMDMCNISQQTHMKQNYPDNLSRQQSYPPDASTVHHHQVHPGYKPESQYQQYPQLPKYNMPSQCRKYPPPPSNDFLAKLERLNPSMARSIMSEHHIRESQTTYPSMDQSRVYSQNQRYYPPTHLQNNLSYNYQPYNYPSSCNYKHPEYPRTNQMPVGGTQYPSLNPHVDRSLSPRNIHMMNYGTSPQKISPNYSQYNQPEYAQHYQHRRASMPQEYYQQTCRTNPYMGGHQISPESSDNRSSSGGLRHFIENWAEEDAPAEITPIFKENIRIHNNDASNEQVFVINSSDIPQCLENVSLVPTENGQYIIKSGALDNSVVRIKETTENNGERTVNLQIVEAPPTKPDCMLAEETKKTDETPTVPYQEKPTKDCDEETKSSQTTTEEEEEEEEEGEGKSEETSVIVSNEVSVIKDMPLIEEEHQKTVVPAETEENKELPEDSSITSTTKRTQRIFSVDDIIGNSPTHTRRSSLQFHPKGDQEEKEDEEETTTTPPPPPTPPPPTPTPPPDETEESADEEMEYRNAISVEEDSIILEIGGAWVQLNINQTNGTKVLSVLPLSESLVIDVNGNYQDKVTGEPSVEEIQEDGEVVEDIATSMCQSEVVIGEENMDCEVILDLENTEKMEDVSVVTRELEKEEEEEEEVGKPEVAWEEEVKKPTVVQEEEVVKKPKVVQEMLEVKKPKMREEEEEEETKKPKKRDERRKFRESEDKKKSVSKKSKDREKTQRDKKPVEADARKREVQEDVMKPTKKKEEPKKTDEEDSKQKEVVKEPEPNKKEETEVTVIKEIEEKIKIKEIEKEPMVVVTPPQAVPVNEEAPEEPTSPKKEEARPVETKESEKPATKAAKKLYTDMKTKTEENNNRKESATKRSISKLEETVNKIKSLKEKISRDENKAKKPSIKDVVDKKTPKIVKKVTFNLEAEVREITKEEYDRKRLSLEEYNSRKRRSAEETRNKIMEDTVTSTEDINDRVVEQVALSIENAMKDSTTRKKSPPRTPSNWEEDTPSPQSPVAKIEAMSTTNRKCIIDANEFNIKPIESVSTPSPVSSSQFSYSEDDSLQVYKDVVDSKLNSLNIRIPKLSKPKPVDRISVLLDRLVNKGSMTGEELEKVKKFIEIKRKMMEEEKKLTYEVKAERDYKDLKLHFKKVPEKRKKKRFRNLYAEDTSEDSDSSRSEGVGDYSVYQRDSQGVPKLIFKRKSGLPQPFVKLERSQAVELLAKKRKLY